MAIWFHNEFSSKKISQKRILKNWIKSSAEYYNYNVGEINIIILSDEELLKINKKYLSHNYYTDIITFDYSRGNEINGDIYISLDSVIINTKEFHTTLTKEFLRVIIHGILHLIGFDDADDKQKTVIRNEEERHLKNFNLNLKLPY